MCKMERFVKNIVTCLNFKDNRLVISIFFSNFAPKFRLLTILYI